MLMRFDPFQEITRASLPGTRRQPTSLPTDAYRQDDTVHIWIDVPGVRGDDLDVTVERSSLRVTTARSWEPGDDVQVLAGERPHAATQGAVSTPHGIPDHPGG